MAYVDKCAPQRIFLDLCGDWYCIVIFNDFLTVAVLVEGVGDDYYVCIGLYFLFTLSQVPTDRKLPSL